MKTQWHWHRGRSEKPGQTYPKVETCFMTEVASMRREDRMDSFRLGRWLSQESMYLMGTSVQESRNACGEKPYGTHSGNPGTEGIARTQWSTDLAYLEIYQEEKTLSQKEQRNTWGLTANIVLQVSTCTYTHVNTHTHTHRQT